MSSFNATARSMTLAAAMALLAACGGGGGYGGDGGGSQVTNPPPTITLSAPTARAVNRTVTLTADVTAPAGVTRVEFLVDGTVVGTVTTAPFTFAWDTSAVADGAHSVTARITDAANVVVTSAAASVTVTNNPAIAVALSPGEEVHRPASTASGSGELRFNLISGAVSGGVEVTGVAATMAHIHRAFAGANGAIIVNFTQSAANANRWEPQSGSVLSADQINDLLAGRLYVNVHSAAFPAGEIRGQLQPENIDVVLTTMNGAAVSPPVATAATGIAATTIDAQAATATVHVNATGVDDSTEAHVHKAAGGANNSAALISLTKDGAAPSHWSAELQLITSQDRTDFDANGWYVDIHTPANPAGAIRGQITPNAAAAPTLTQLQTTIFTPVCSVCHNGVGGALPGSMNLTSTAASFAALVNVASVQQAAVLRVAPGDANASYLVRKLEGAAGVTGARMPLGGPFLDQATIDRVRAWIGDGAQNN